MSDVKSLLRSHGPCLTSELITTISSSGVSSAAARKRVQRAQDDPEVQRLAGLRFEKNARFIYLSEQYGTREFWRAFEQACRTAGLSYWCAISTLRSRGGIVPVQYFSVVSGAPRNRKNQLSPDRILERLIAVKALVITEFSETCFVELNPFLGISQGLNRLRAEEIAEDVALHGLHEWAKRIGIGSYDRFNIRGGAQEAEVSGVSWDMSAPSYIRPLMSVHNGKASPGFFVCDLNLYETLTDDAALAFVRKCDLAAAPQKSRPIMPMIVAQVFSADALSTLKSKGILAVTLRNLFGVELADALRSLVLLLSDFGARAAANPEHVRTVMKTLTRITGSADNLRGALFELVVGCLVKDVEGGYLETGRRATDLESGRKAEIDVLLNLPDGRGLLVVECKAKTPSSKVSLRDVQRWYGDRAPLINSIFSEDSRRDGKPIRFELWTNGAFVDSARDWFAQQRHEHEGYTTSIVDGEELKRYSLQATNSSLRDTLNEHYFRSPLRTVSGHR
ncbi:hypothetical protein [Pseudooceanicola sp. 200-1SW]|uniref:hypothetical protein n=1 Tax=Pseudooceanicola sp. 200-1SW TaxID=3425949 RepID=UPI003D7F5E9B